MRDVVETLVIPDPSSLKMIIIVDDNQEDEIRQEFIVKSDVDIEELEETIAKYKEDVEDWDFDGLIADCFAKHKIVPFDLYSGIEVINL